MSAVQVIELILAGFFFAGGIRSFWIWSRRSIDSDHIRDQISYALYRTGRIGLWFAVGAIFLYSSLSGLEGRALADDIEDHRWFLMVLLLLALMQFIGGYLLGRSVTKRPGSEEPPSAGGLRPPPDDGS